jgi:hypothetical protein
LLWVWYVRKNNWSWLKTVAKRIDAQATLMRDRSQGATSDQLFALGLQLIAKAKDAALLTGRITKGDALTYRDGLIIALLAAVPLVNEQLRHSRSISTW